MDFKKGTGKYLKTQSPSVSALHSDSAQSSSDSMSLDIVSKKKKKEEEFQGLSETMEKNAQAQPTLVFTQGSESWDISDIACPSSRTSKARCAQVL